MARLLGQHPDASMMTGSPHPEHEGRIHATWVVVMLAGQYLTSLMSHVNRMGGQTAYAWHRDAHLTPDNITDIADTLATYTNALQQVGGLID